MFRRKIKSFEIESITIAGLEIVTNSILSQKSEYEETLIPELWEDFWSIFPKLGVKSNGISFGVSTFIDEDLQNSKIKYLAGTEFKRGVPPGLDFKTVNIASGKYVRYTHRGLIETIRDSYVEAYTQWFPSLKMKMRNAPHLELYDQRFNPSSPKCEMDILITVK